MTVISSAGSTSKVDYLKSIGADVAFNYKTDDENKVLAEYGKGIDVNWVNVGGEAFETEINHMNNHGRLICECPDRGGKDRIEQRFCFDMDLPSRGLGEREDADLFLLATLLLTAYF